MKRTLCILLALLLLTGCAAKSHVEAEPTTKQTSIAAANADGSSSVAGSESEETEPVGSEAPSTEITGTEPPETASADTEAPETEPIDSQEPAETQEPSTEPVETQEPATEPIETEPATEPVETQEPSTEPAEEPRIVRPMEPLFSVEEGLPDGWYSVALASEDFYEENGTLRLRTEIYDLERFDPEQMLALKPGDQIETLGSVYTIFDLSFYSFNDDDLPAIELSDENDYPLTGYLSFCCSERLKMYTRPDSEPLVYYGIYTDDYTNLFPVGVADLPFAPDAEFEDHQVYDWEAPTDEYGAPAFVPNRPAADLPALVASYEAHRAAEDDYLYNNEQDALAFPKDSMTIRVEDGVITAVLRRFVP